MPRWTRPRRQNVSIPSIAAPGPRNNHKAEMPAVPPTPSPALSIGRRVLTPVIEEKMGILEVGIQMAMLVPRPVGAAALWYVHGRRLLRSKGVDSPAFLDSLPGYDGYDERVANSHKQVEVASFARRSGEQGDLFTLVACVNELPEGASDLLTERDFVRGEGYPGYDHPPVPDHLEVPLLVTNARSFPGDLLDIAVSETLGELQGSVLELGGVALLPVTAQGDF